MPYQKIYTILADNPLTTSWLKTCSLLEKTNSLYQQSIPPALGLKSRITHITAENIHIVAANSAIALKLKQLSPAISKTLHEVLGKKLKVRIVIRMKPPDNIASTPQQKLLRKIPQQGIQALTTLQQQLKENSLGVALQRLIIKNNAGVED